MVINSGSLDFRLLSIYSSQQTFKRCHPRPLPFKRRNIRNRIEFPFQLEQAPREQQEHIYIHTLALLH